MHMTCAGMNARDSCADRWKERKVQMGSRVKSLTMLFLLMVFLITIGCSGKPKGSSDSARICEIAQQQMLDSARIIAGCKGHISMLDIQSENDRYGEQFRRINASALNKCNPNFKDGDKWPPVVEAVKNWQISCYWLMLAMNEMSRDKFPAYAVSDQIDKAVKDVKRKEEIIKKHCPGLSITDIQPK